LRQFRHGLERVADVFGLHRLPLKRFRHLPAAFDARILLDQ